MSRRIISLVTVVLIFLAAGFLWIHNPPTTHDPNTPSQKEKIITLNIKSVRLQVAVAATGPAREQGLSGRTSLGQNSGMLFVFREDTMPQFWMKEMNFPLDFIWLDSGKKIVQIDPNISPITFPETFQPKVPIRYVLEVNAGFAAIHGLTTGDQATFQVPD